MINEVRLLGIVVREPERKIISSGATRITMTIKTSEPRKGSNGETMYNDYFHRVTFWGDRWEWLMERVHNSCQVYFEGKLEYSTREVDGNKVYETNIVGRNVIITR